MRLPLFAVLCAGAAASTAMFCQSPAPQKIDPDKLFEMPKDFSRQGPDYKTFKPPLPPKNHDTILEFPKIDTPRLKPGDSPLNHQIDPKIILHPPWHSTSKGQEVSRRHYPGLKFLPLHRGAPIPQ